MTCTYTRVPTIPNSLLFLLFAAWISVGYAAAPIVNAGVDSTVYSRDRGLFLYGTVNDNGATRDSVVWSQVSGPGTVKITAPTFEGSKVGFPDTNGVFVLELRAFYGAESYTDIVNFTVKFTPPVVITPAEGATVPIGSPCVIRWRFEPAVTGVQIDSSLNGGMDFGYMAGPINYPETTWTWDVPDTLVPGDTVYLQVFQYQRRNDNSAPYRMIILGPPAKPASSSRSGGCGSGAGLALLPPLAMKLAARRRRTGRNVRSS